MRWRNRVGVWLLDSASEIRNKADVAVRRAFLRILWAGLWASALSGCFDTHEVVLPCCDDVIYIDTPDGAIGSEAVEPDASEGTCMRCSPNRPVVGVDFEPVRTRTEDGETVAHLELVGLAFLPDDRGVLLWEKAGRIAHYRQEGADFVFIGQMTVEDVFTGSDCGLSWLALDPLWHENHYFYITKCYSKTHGALVRYTFDGEHIEAAADTASVLLKVGDSRAVRAWHNLGMIGFFDDEEHSMWVLAGEKDIASNGQDLTDDLGSVLRIIPRRGEGEEGYDPHPDNPFASPLDDPDAMSGPNIYAWGLRSPWRGSLDSQNRLVIGEVGSKIEEINVVSEPGQNFGWNRADGPCTKDCDGLTDPIVHWHRGSDHPYRRIDAQATPTSMRAVFAGTTYRQAERDRYRGFLDDTILFSDICVGFVRALRIDEHGEVKRNEHVGHIAGLTSTVQSPDGFLYATSYGSCQSRNAGIGGGLYRIVPRREGDLSDQPRAPASDPIIDDPLGPMPTLISQTGIFADDELTQPIARAIRYEPSLPLYSNGSDKERWMLLPEGEKVDNSDREAWRFPVGTQFWKTFTFETHDDPQQRVETRVIRVTESGYEYAVYAWKDGDGNLLSLENQLATNLYLGPDRKLFHHRIPSRFDCRTCHESNRTAIIGFDELRLNAAREGESETQLQALAAAGVFTDPIPEEPAHVSAADDETRQVLGYLHGNCAHCHNGSANSMSALSLEHGVALANTIDVESQGSGQASGVRIVPGSPSRSLLFRAFARESDDENLEAMPPIGVDRADEDAIEMLREWIRGLPSE